VNCAPSKAPDVFEISESETRQSHCLVRWSVFELTHQKHKNVFGRPFVKRFSLFHRTVVCLSVLSFSVLSVTLVLWPNGWTDQDETWHLRRPRPWLHCVRWGPSSPSPKRGGVPQFSAHICYGKMAGWIKMPLGREVGLSPSDIVLYGDPAPLPQRGRSLPIFGLCLLWPNGWMDQDATWYGSRPQPRPYCVRQGSSSTPSPREKGTAASFRPMSIVATVAHLSYC